MSRRSCPACQNEGSVTRRRFLTSTASAAAIATTLPRFVHAAPSQESAAETVVGELYESLSESQRQEICFNLNHPSVKRVSANWHVATPRIRDRFFTDSQRGMIEEIVRSITSEEGHERLLEQMDDDDGGLGEYSIGIFGQPGSDHFQWMLTGRHCTMRADGNTTAKAAFGGPVVYGHGEESKPESNLFYYQTKAVNELFSALDPEQAKEALWKKPPKETKVQIQGEQGKFTGLTVKDMSADQRELVDGVLKTVLGPYRQEDGEEAMALIAKHGGIDALRFAFYQEGDLEGDGVWDVWRIEGPSAVIHFRGAPHVHAYIHVSEPNGKA